MTVRHVMEHTAAQHERVGEQLARLDVEQDDVRREGEKVEADRAAAADARTQSQAALERITLELAERRTQLAMSRSEHEERTRDLRAREQELAAVEGRLASLEELAASRADFGDAARMVLVQANGHVGQQGAVADYLEVDSRYERAVEACLGDLLQHVIVERHDQAAAGLVTRAAAGCRTLRVCRRRTRLKRIPPARGSSRAGHRAGVGCAACQRPSCRDDSESHSRSLRRREFRAGGGVLPRDGRADRHDRWRCASRAASGGGRRESRVARNPGDTTGDQGTARAGRTRPTDVGATGRRGRQTRCAHRGSHQRDRSACRTKSTTRKRRSWRTTRSWRAQQKTRCGCRAKPMSSPWSGAEPRRKRAALEARRAEAEVSIARLADGTATGRGGSR